MLKILQYFFTLNGAFAHNPPTRHLLSVLFKLETIKSDVQIRCISTDIYVIFLNYIISSKSLNNNFSNRFLSTECCFHHLKIDFKFLKLKRVANRHSDRYSIPTLILRF